MRMLDAALLQVVFLSGFGYLYINVKYEKGTMVLTLAPEGSMDAVTDQHSRYQNKSGRFIAL